MSFDEQPDGDIHGECAAEIHRLDAGVVVPTGKTGSCFARLECDQLDAAIDKARAAHEVAG